MARVRGALPLLVLALLLIAACDDGIEAAPPELAELAVRLDEARLTASAPGVGPTPGASPGETGDAPASPVGTLVTIGATGVDGVSLRSACRADARIAGGWRDGTEVAVIEVGVGECAGWTRVQAAGVGSWVSDQYLPGLGAGRPAAEVDGAAPLLLPEVATVGGWIAALDEASSRIALIARTATGSSMPFEADFLRVIESELGLLQTSLSGSPLAASGSACGAAGGTLVEVAATLRSTAGRLATLFEEWPAAAYPADVDRLARQYSALVVEAGAEAAGCLEAV